MLFRVCNLVKADDATKCIQIPDRTAGEILNDIEKKYKFDRQELEEKLSFPIFSMAAGDFVEIYGHKSHENSWDAVITCFFVDTAPVVME